jgi:mRNA interferase RelE/StbE
VRKNEILFSKVAAKELESNPRPVECKKLVGEKEDLWRVRVGDYRIVYTINDTVFLVDIHRVGYRGDIYK